MTDSRPSRPVRVSRPQVELDVTGLWAAIEARLARTASKGAAPQTARSVATELGFGPSVFTRIKQAATDGTGDLPSVEVYLTICAWLRLGPARFARPRAGVEGESSTS